MKKVILIILIGVMIMFFCTTQGYSQTGKDLLEKMIAAQGGREKLSNVKDSQVKGTMELLAAGVSGNITIVRKEPDRQRLDIDVTDITITQAYDGKKVWMINPQLGEGSREMPEPFASAFKRQVIGNNALLKPEKYGITFHYKGKEKVEDKDCLLLESVNSDGYKTLYYLDAKTFLVVKSKFKTLDQAGTEIDQENYYSDYRKVDGLTVAFKVTSFRQGTEFMKLTLSDVKYNLNVKDELFQMTN